MSPPSAKNAAMQLTTENLLHNSPDGVALGSVRDWARQQYALSDDASDDASHTTNDTAKRRDAEPSRCGTRRSGHANPRATSPSSMVHDIHSLSSESQAEVPVPKHRTTVAHGDNNRNNPAGSVGKSRKKQSGKDAAAEATLKALLAEARRKGEEPDVHAILHQLQEQEHKKIAEKTLNRKGHHRHVNDAFLKKARRGPGTQAGSEVLKSIARWRETSYQVLMPTVDEIRAKYEAKLATTDQVHIPDGEIKDWSQRQWRDEAADAKHQFFCEWLRDVSDREDAHIMPWCERLQDGRLHLVAQAWLDVSEVPCDPEENPAGWAMYRHDLMAVQARTDEQGFYAFLNAENDWFLSVLSLEDELNFTHRHETSAGYMHNFTLLLEQEAREEKARLDEQRERAKADAEAAEQQRKQCALQQQAAEDAAFTGPSGQADEPVTLPELYIRPMEEKDLDDVLNIYKHYIKHAHVLVERTRITREELVARMQACRANLLPCLIAAQVTHGTGHARSTAFEHVQGFAYVVAFGAKGTVHDKAGLVTLAVSPEYTRKRVGTCLMEQLLTILDDGFVARTRCAMACAEEDRPIYISGQARALRALVLSINYPHEEECEYTGWVRPWLTKYGFKRQGTLFGVGHKKRMELDCDLLVRRVTPCNASGSRPQGKLRHHRTGLPFTAPVRYPLTPAPALALPPFTYFTSMHMSTV
ncbi:hypothetical protein KEM52_005385 [Ascosphaera acerosa]|nr:hypothetical protein KEM52_005385 [Ascosphaera acerosa]